ncbi:hypothetical protein ACIG0D_21595 [Streptomyces sp. NPDC052773]|jgi:hypothetical protein|uniref:hypothetical protein n=1 Tax=Streptomyces sp. NPDC052773 TaxID=3365693 RepID=UPI002BFDAD07|nr:hypothetical protein [Streptomyces sp.]
MPFPPSDVRLDLMCAPGADGHWRGWITVAVAASALRRLGLHPAQRTAAVGGASPPPWWHAAGERYARGPGRWAGERRGGGA